ncbi:MAG: hypothetical protein Alpg2KO_32000 [Alphaproteobacteria bacterium]
MAESQVTRDDLALFDRPVPQLELTEGDPAEWARVAASETPDATDRLRAAQNLAAWIKWQERRLDKSVESQAQHIIARQDKIQSLADEIDPNAEVEFDKLIDTIVDDDAYRRRYGLAADVNVEEHFRLRFLHDCKQLGVDAALRSFISDPEQFMPIKNDGGWTKRTWRNNTLGWKLRFSRDTMRDYYKAATKTEELAKMTAEVEGKLSRSTKLRTHVDATRALEKYPLGPVNRQVSQLSMRLATDYVRLRSRDPVRAWILADNWTLGNDCALWTAQRRVLSDSIRKDPALKARAEKARIIGSVNSARSWMDRLKPWRGRPVDPALIGKPPAP